MIELCPGPSPDNRSSRCDVCGLWIHSYDHPCNAHQLPHLPWGIRWDIKNKTLVWEKVSSEGQAIVFYRGEAIIPRPSRGLVARLVLNVVPHKWGCGKHTEQLGLDP